MASIFTPGSAAFRREMDQAAAILEKQFGLLPGILSRMMAKESQYDPNAYNTVTQAAGIVQQRPIFVRDVTEARPHIYKIANFDPYNPKQALYAAAAYLNFIFKRTGSNSWAWPLIAYNWGEGAMNGFRKGVSLGMNPKLPDETIAYVRYIAPEYSRA